MQSVPGADRGPRAGSPRGRALRLAKLFARAFEFDRLPCAAGRHRTERLEFGKSIKKTTDPWHRRIDLTVDNEGHLEKSSTDLR